MGFVVSEHQALGWKHYRVFFVCLFFPPWSFFCYTLFLGILSIKPGWFQRHEVTASFSDHDSRYWQDCPSQVNRLAAYEERCGMIDMSAGHMALHCRLITREPHVTSPHFSCRFWFHFYSLLNFVFIFMEHWMKPEFYVFEKGTWKRKASNIPHVIS